MQQFLLFSFFSFLLFSAKSKTQEFYLYINGQIYTAHTQKIRIHFSFLGPCFRLPYILKNYQVKTTQYWLFFTLFQGQCSLFANSFFHAYQTNFVGSSSSKYNKNKISNKGFDLVFCSCMFEEWKKSKWVVYPLIITYTHEIHTKTVNYNLKWEICGPFYKTFIVCNILFYFPTWEGIEASWKVHHSQHSQAIHFSPMRIYLLKTALV